MGQGQGRAFDDVVEDPEDLARGDRPGVVVDQEAPGPGVHPAGMDPVDRQKLGLDLLSERANLAEPLVADPEPAGDLVDDLPTGED